MQTVRLIIKGKVQGVFYRASAKEQAERLHIRGWVRNTEDGHVECLVSGPDDRVNRFIAWCRQGPSAAHVTGVDVYPSDEQQLDGFQIRR